MRTQLDWTSSLGFRQLIEDGLAVLRDEPISAERRAYVLGHLEKLISQASQGSELIRSRALSVTPAERSAYESFSVIDRFLADAEEAHWSSVLKQTEAALNRLQREDAPVTPDQRNAAMALLEKILSVLAKQPRPGVPTRPEELWVGS